MTRGYPLTCFARLIVGTLERANVKHLIVSPGSRSTPLLMAAKRHSHLRMHTVLDERSAAFVALGLARATRSSVALLCTSGTAAANYLPALVEGRLTGVPLVVLTADRPVGLQDCAAPQTIDQTRIFGKHVVGSWSLSPPGPNQDELRQIRRLILSALALATNGSDPGPVHFNLHCDKPLESFEPKDDDDRHFDRLIETILAVPLAPPLLGGDTPNEEAVTQVCNLVESEPLGLIACGFDPEAPELDPLALARFARISGYPVLLDASHPLRLACPTELVPYVVAPFDPLLRIESWREHQTPKVVLQIGRPLLSARWESYLEQVPEGRLLLIARRGWPDPTGRGVLVDRGSPTEFLTVLAERLENVPPRSSGWQARWLRAALATSTILKKRLGAESATNPVGELSAVFAVLRALPPSSRLVIGNSLPIRHVDFVAFCDPTRQVRVEALRGASGIDGVTSTAIGFGLADDRPTTLLVGDLSFLHDVGGLWSAQSVDAALAIVVLNNGGGRIFEQLPIRRSTSEEELRHFTTPHQCDLSHASALFGLPHLRVSSVHGIADALREAHGHPGVTVIEIVVAPSSNIEQTVQAVAAVKDELVRLGLLSAEPSTRGAESV